MNGRINVETLGRRAGCGASRPMLMSPEEMPHDHQGLSNLHVNRNRAAMLSTPEGQRHMLCYRMQTAENCRLKSSDDVCLTWSWLIYFYLKWHAEFFFYLPLSPLSCMYFVIVVTPVESLCMNTSPCVRDHGQMYLQTLSDEFPCSLDYFLFWRAPAPSPGPTPTGSGYGSVNGKECVSLEGKRVLNLPLMSLFSCSWGKGWIFAV